MVSEQISGRVEIVHTVLASNANCFNGIPTVQ